MPASSWWAPGPPAWRPPAHSASVATALCSREARLPGLAAWRRVVDYRLGQLGHHPNVEVYRESEITPEDALGYGFSDVLVATGARWRADGVGRWHASAIPADADAVVLTPDDLLSGSHELSRPGTAPQHVLVFDDDHFYLGGILAELLAQLGHDVRLVTPAPLVSSWTAHTLEIGDIQRRVRAAGITVDPSRTLVGIGAREARTACVFTGAESPVAADAVVLVTARLPRDALFAELERQKGDWAAHGVRSGGGVVRPPLCGGLRHARTALTGEELPARVHGTGAARVALLPRAAHRSSEPGPRPARQPATTSHRCRHGRVTSA